jgi:hypothetical protein
MTGLQEYAKKFESSLEYILEKGIGNVAFGKNDRLKRSVAKNLIAAAALALPSSDYSAIKKLLGAYACLDGAKKRSYSRPVKKREIRRPKPVVKRHYVPAKPKRVYEPAPKQAPAEAYKEPPAPAKPKHAKPQYQPRQVIAQPPAPRIEEAPKPAQPLEERVERDSPAEPAHDVSISRVIRSAVVAVYDFVPDGKRVQAYRAKYKDVIAKYCTKTGKRQKPSNPGKMKDELVKLMRMEKDASIHPKLATVTGKVYTIEDIRVFGKMTYEQLRECMQNPDFKKRLGNIVTGEQDGTKRQGYLFENVEAALSLVTGNGKK